MNLTGIPIGYHVKRSEQRSMLTCIRTQSWSVRGHTGLILPLMWIWNGICWFPSAIEIISSVLRSLWIFLCIWKFILIHAFRKEWTTYLIVCSRVLVVCRLTCRRSQVQFLYGPPFYFQRNQRDRGLCPGSRRCDTHRGHRFGGEMKHEFNKCVIMWRTNSKQFSLIISGNGGRPSAMGSSGELYE